MASLPKTYQAVVLPAKNSGFKAVTVDLKHPSDRQVLVKVLASGVCYSDLAVATGTFGDHVFPRVPGHEIVGDIVELGNGVTEFQVGQRVGGGWHGGHDGTCRSCMRGQFQLCDHQVVNGLHMDGGYAEYVLLQAQGLVRVPADMDPATVAPLLCAGVTVFNGIRKMHVEQGALVAVQGIGGLGHLAVQYASKMGYTVVALSRGSDKAAFAKQLGAHHYIDTAAEDSVAELAKLGGADLVVQTAPDAESTSRLFEALAPGGKLLTLAPAGGVKINSIPLVLKSQSVHGWMVGNALDCEEAIKFAQTHRIKPMVESFPFSEVQQAVNHLVAGKARFRNVMVMN